MSHARSRSQLECVLLCCMMGSARSLRCPPPRATSAYSSTATAFARQFSRRSAALNTATARFTSDVGDDGISAERVVAIRDAGPKGLGAFAMRSFTDGETVGDYMGEQLSTRDANARYHGTAPKTWRDRLWIAQRESRGVPRTGNYLFEVTDDLLIDAEDVAVSNWTRYINHANDPNLRVKSLPYAFGGKPRVWFVATRDIQIDDELCFDYGGQYWGDDELAALA